MTFRGMRASRRASSWKPTQLTGCVLWLDCLETDSYTITPGSGGALPTVGSIYNLVSGVEWTEATNPPNFVRDAINGRPALHNPIGGIRRLISDEAAVFGAMSGDDTPWTLAIVMRSLAASTNMAALAVSNSGGASNNTIQFGHVTAGLPRLGRRDGAGTAPANSRNAFVQPGAHVYAVRFAGSTVSMWLDDELDALPNAQAATDITAITPNRTALFCIPDSSPDSFFYGYIGAVCLFAGALSDADVQQLRTWLTARWLSPITVPGDVPNLTCWLADRVTTTGGEVSNWDDRGTLNNDFAPATSGQRPDQQPIDWFGAPDFVSANSDCSVNSNALTDTGAITIGIKWKLDAIPAAGSSVTLASPKLHDSNNDWFEIILHNDVSGQKSISFGRENGTSGSLVGFDVELDPDSISPDHDGGVHRLLVTFDGSSTYTARYDGVVQTVSASGAFIRATGDKGSLGARVSSADATSQGIDGKLLKFTTHERVLNATELDQLDRYLAEGWEFTTEMLPGLKFWFDPSDAESIEVTPGTPDKLTSFRNKASGVLWTESTNPPEFFIDEEGRAAIRGNGVDMHITSTEAAVVGAVTGTDQAWTVYAVIKPSAGWSANTWLGFAGSLATNHYLGFGTSASGSNPAHTAIVNAGSGEDSNSLGFGVPDDVQVVSWVHDGASISGHLNDSPASPDADAKPDASATFIDRVSLFRLPKPTPESYSDFSLGELLVYEGAHSTADRLAVQRYLMRKWDVDFDLLTIPSLVAYLDMLDPSTYTVTPGSPDTVTSILNKRSRVAWNDDAGTDNYPLYESSGLNGLPCIKGETASARRLVTTESPVVSAFGGASPNVTVIAVVEPGPDFPSDDLRVWSASDQTINNDGFLLNQDSGAANWELARTGDSPSSVAVARAAGPQIVTAKFDGTNKSIRVNGGAPVVAATGSAVLANIRFGLFCRADLSPDRFFGGRLGALLVFNEALSDRVREKVERKLASDWGIAL